MCYHQQHEAASHAQGLPAKLSVLNAILLGNCEWVGKNAGSRLEAHAMLPQITFRLRKAPFKPYFHNHIVTTFLLSVKNIQKSAQKGLSSPPEPGEAACA